MKIFLDSKEFLHEGVRTRWIEGTGNRYAVREDGEIVSYYINHNKILKKSYHEKGYEKINIRYGTGIKTKRVHRLVAQAFIINPEPELYKEIDHIDMVKDNNHYTNLRWCSGKMNHEYMYKMKHGEDWEPKYIIEKKEVEQRKVEIKQRKQERIDAMPYGTLEEMMKQTGKHIVVNGVEYESVREAARYIAEQEPEKKYETIRTELKKMNGGKRKPGMMYGKYKVELVKNNI